MVCLSAGYLRRLTLGYLCSLESCRGYLGPCLYLSFRCWFAYATRGFCPWGKNLRGFVRLVMICLAQGSSIALQTSHSRRVGDNHCKYFQFLRRPCLVFAPWYVLLLIILNCEKLLFMQDLRKRSSTHSSLNPPLAKMGQCWLGPS